MSVTAIKIDWMSVTVNVRIEIMGRWQPDSRGRLQEAALALYSERGFDRTTAAQIADRAGVTERTFFRHFTDKREVLVAGQAAMSALLAEGIALALLVARHTRVSPDREHSAGPRAGSAAGLDFVLGSPEESFR